MMENAHVESLEDRLLVLRAQQGDANSFRRLVERYERRLLYFVLRLTDDPEQALDVLQEVWLATFRMLPRLQSAGAFRTWLYRVAYGKTVDQIRAKGRLPERGETLPVDPSAPDDAPPRLDNAELVHAGLSRISVVHREVLTLHFLEAMSLEEIARVLDCPLGTVKSRMYYAKKAFRCVVEELSGE